MDVISKRNCSIVIPREDVNHQPLVSQNRLLDQGVGPLAMVFIMSTDMQLAFKNKHMFIANTNGL